MTIAIKALGEGQLANTKGTIYTTPGSTQAIVKSITLVNTSGSAVTVNLYVKAGATSRQVIPNDMSLGAGELLVLDTIFTLEAADLVEGDASAATTVDYTINGGEVA